MYSETMVMPSLPDIQKDFDVSTSELAWVLTAYMLSAVAFTPLIAKFSDIIGRKRTLTILVPIYSTALALNSITHNYTLFIILRAVQGASLSIFPIAFSMIVEQLPREEVPRAQGIISAMFSIGAVIGMVLGAYIADIYSWREVFATAAPFGYFLTIIINMMLREYRPKVDRVSIDYLGAFLIGSGVAMLCYAFERAPHVGWSSLEVITAITSSIMLLLLFTYWELTVPTPLINMTLLADRNVFAGNVIGMIVGFSMFGLFQAAIILFRLPKPVGQELTVLETGLYMIPASISSLVSAIIFATLIRKLGVKYSLILSLITAVPLSSSYLLANLSDLTHLVIATSLTACAVTMSLVPIINIIVFTVGTQELGVMTGMNMIFRFIGGSLGPAVVGSLQDTFKTSITKIIQTSPQEYIPIVFSVPSHLVLKIYSIIAIILLLISIPISLRTYEVYKVSISKMRS